jgi:FlaG/FlaF family flagellin (archaellin)
MEEGAAVNPRDMKKIAPILGVLLVVAVVLYIVGRFLL